MFDLISGVTPRAPRPHAVPILISVVVHAAVVGTVVISTALVVGEQLPEVGKMAAFVAVQPPLEPPAPPPAPALLKTRPLKSTPAPASDRPAPVAPPEEILSEPQPQDFDEAEFEGVEGGVPGGVPGGIFSGFQTEIPPPPPPLPQPPAPSRPIRVGGEVREPALVYRVEPVYPAVAVAAGVEGTVILEAIVDREGRVESLKVLRSGGVFDRSALEAVRQWRYSPVLLNGRPERFILTVVVSFHLTGAP